MKKILLVLIALFGVLPLFAKSYADCLAEAKKYEAQKKWCYALGSYYDALQTKEAPENKREACEGYAKLRDAIKSGKPGFSSYDDFTINDEWEKLIIDAEKYFSSICRVDIEEVALVKDSVQLDFQAKSKTLTYGVKIKYKMQGNRYDTILSIIRQGLKTMIDFYSKQYSNFKTFDGADDWPKYSVSYKNNNVYNIDGALVYNFYLSYNAFCFGLYLNYDFGLYDFLVNVIDESGKELVKGRRWLLGTSESAEKGEYQIVYTGISQSVADLIDSGKAHANIAACYLAYGKYDVASDKGGRSFVNKLPEVQISMDKCLVGKEPIDYGMDAFVDNVLFNKSGFSDDLVTINIYDHSFKMLKTEVTQKLYQSIMLKNPSNYEAPENPVENISWYDAVYFCNKLSQKFGYEPVYSVNGESDVSKWNYEPHRDDFIARNVVQDIRANGFRLPTKEEWQFAARGGQDFRYSGSNNLDDVGWNKDNSGGKTHPVGQKRPNGYGLYDMSGNVWEWIWDDHDRYERYYYGGSYYCNNYSHDYEDCEVTYGDYTHPRFRYDYLGFRVVRTLTDGEQ